MPRTGEVKLRIANSDALVHVPTARSGPTTAVVVCHPWGPLGGSMHNNVVAAAAAWFRQLGCITVRFNFNGTQIGRGHTQVQQVLDVCRELSNGDVTTAALASEQLSATGSDSSEAHPTVRHILLVGYSYGSLITGSASADVAECVATINIAPPFAVQHWLLLFDAQYHLDRAAGRSGQDGCSEGMDTGLKRLFVIGSADNFTSQAVFSDTVTKQFPAGTAATAFLEGADHFFGGCEKELMDIVGQWLLTSFPQLQGDLSQLVNLGVCTASATSGAAMSKMGA